MIANVGAGVYPIGLADNYHFMTVTYDGRNYSLLDQAPPFANGGAANFGSSAAFDAHIVKITNMAGPARSSKASHSAVLRVHRLNTP